MTRITLFFFLLLSISIHTVNAQKIDLDKRKFDTEFAILPTDPTLSYFDRYSVDFFTEQATLDQVGISVASINSFFDLEGYVYTKEQAQFNYTIAIQNPIPLLEGIEDFNETVKNADGTTSQVTKYIAVSVCAIPTNISLRLIPYGTDIYSSSFSTRSFPTVYKSAPQSTREAAQAILNPKTKGINSVVLDHYSNSLKAEILKLKRKYCFQTFKSSSLLWEVDEKSAPELAPFNKEVNAALVILQKLTKSTPIENARKEMEPSINYWTEKAKSIQGVEKNQLKLKYACYYNLVVCQFYLENFDACIANGKLLVLNGYNKNDGVIIQNQALEAKKMIKESGLPSRHQDRPGFKATERFEYTKKKIKKLNYIEQNKQDFIDIKNSFQAIPKQIQSDLRKPQITDTLNYTQSYFTTMKYEWNGKQYEYKEGTFNEGRAIQPIQRYAKKSTYNLDIFNEVGLIPPKKDALVGFSMTFKTNYNNSPKFDADSLLALIKMYAKDNIMDITTCDDDTIPFLNNGIYTSSKRIYGKEYPKLLSADILFQFYDLQPTTGLNVSKFKTNTGDVFTLKVAEIVPVTMNETTVFIENDFYKIHPKGYLVTCVIPEVKLTKINSGTDESYKNEYTTIKNIQFKVLVLSNNVVKK